MHWFVCNAIINQSRNSFWTSISYMIASKRETKTKTKTVFYNSWSQLFKGWIVLSTVQWITQLLLIVLICWIGIYPVDSTIHLLNNWGLVSFTKKRGNVIKRTIKIKPFTYLDVIQTKTKHKHFMVTLSRAVSRPHLAIVAIDIDWQQPSFGKYWFTT